MRYVPFRSSIPLILAVLVLPLSSAPSRPYRPLLQQGIAFGQESLWLVAQSVGGTQEGDHAEAERLFAQGVEQFQRSQFQEALASWQRSLEIYQAIGDRGGEGSTLGNLGAAYISLGQYQQAILVLEQKLALAQASGNRAEEGRALGNLGIVHRNLGQYPQAIERFEQVLAIAREQGDLADEGASLGNLGNTYNDLGQYWQAIEYFEQLLVIARERQEPIREGIALGNMGNSYSSLGQYQRAIALYQQSLALAREQGDHAGEGRVLGSLGNTYNILGQYQQALDFYAEYLAIARAIGDLRSEGNALGNIGVAHNKLGQYEQAIAFYEQRLAITREIGDRAGEGTTLGNMGIAYNDLGEPQQAISRFEQHLAIAREIGDLRGEAAALGNLGITYDNLGDYEQAIDFYRQDLAITQEIGDRAGESFTLSNLGDVLAATESPELAIAFYKQSVNISKKISEDINDSVLRQSYSERNTANTYRELADLLLTQERLPEAYAVLELLKIQELSEYTNEQQALDTFPDVALFPEEIQIVDTHNALLEANQQLQNCEINECADIALLATEQDHASQQYQAAVAALQGRDLNLGSRGIAQDTHFFISKAQAIIEQQPGTVVVYPFVLEDRLWLLWATKDGFDSQPMNGFTQEDLAETVNTFRGALENRYSDVEALQADGKQLYDWLIAPVEERLDDEEDIRHWVLALDRNTRYIPIGALYDGEQYLIEKYDVATILAASLTDAEARSPIGTNSTSLLAAGVSQGSDAFRALPFVPIELDSIVREQDNTDDTEGVYPGQQLLDPAFTLPALQNSLPGKQLLHIATHSEFVPGNRYDSYLLMGNGEKLPIPEISKLGSALNGIHLAVLSACQTGLGGADEEGLEIAGLGYYFFQNEVDAVMASLWNVNDSSTSQLMQLFYQKLSAGTEADPITKAEALRQTQRAMLQSNETPNNDADRFRFVPQNPEDEPRPEIGLAHPYYWAPFILIGNGL